jgi:hypothetical protein
MSKRGLNIRVWLLACLPILLAGTAHAGAQKYEPLSASVKSQLSKAVADAAVEKAAFAESPYVQAWLAEMSHRLAKRIPDAEYRRISSTPCTTNPSAPAWTRNWCWA